MNAAYDYGLYGLWYWGVVWLFIIAMLALAAVVMLKSDARSKSVQRDTILIARADEQHARCMNGDDLGVYGEYPPADIE